MNRSLTLALSVAFAAALPLAASASTITSWVFENIGTQAAPFNSASATSGTGTATQLGMTNNYTYNNGEGPGSVAACDVLASAGASSGAGSFGWRIRGNGNAANSGPGVANGWNSQAPMGTQGAEFTASTVGFNSITVSADVNVTTQAEGNLAILYTLDATAANPVWVNATITSAGLGGSSIQTGSGVNTIAGNFVQLGAGVSGWDNGITASVPAAANNDAKFAIEIVNASTGADAVNVSGTALNNSSGNWRLDNVIISGASAVPEPASLGVLAMGAVALLGRRRRAR